jgi:hypothetical protein
MDFNTPILNNPPWLKRSNCIPNIPESENEDDDDNNLFDSNQAFFGLRNGMRRMNNFNSNLGKNEHDFDEIKRAIACDDFDDENNLPPVPVMTTPTNKNRNIPFPNMPGISDLCSNLNILKIICQGDTSILEEETVENENEEDDLESFIPSEDTTSCYTTPSALSTIRSMSQC